VPVWSDTLVFVAEGAGELFAELEPGTEETDFDVGFAQAERAGGVVHGQTFHVAQ
jgi:hypothetical protein